MWPTAAAVARQSNSKGSISSLAPEPLTILSINLPHPEHRLLACWPVGPQRHVEELVAGPGPDTIRKRRERRHSTEVAERPSTSATRRDTALRGPLDLLELLVDAGLAGRKVLHELRGPRADLLQQTFPKEHRPKQWHAVASVQLGDPGEARRRCPSSQLVGRHRLVPTGSAAGCGGFVQAPHGISHTSADGGLGVGERNVDARDGSTRRRSAESSSICARASAAVASWSARSRARSSAPTRL